MNANIFKSIKELPIGLILKKGVLGFTGEVGDFDGELVGDGKVVVKIMREATKEEFLFQFEKEDKKIYESTLANLDDYKFYEISTD